MREGNTERKLVENESKRAREACLDRKIETDRERREGLRVGRR